MGGCLANYSPWPTPLTSCSVHFFSTLSILGQTHDAASTPDCCSLRTRQKPVWSCVLFSLLITCVVKEQMFLDMSGHVCWTGCTMRYYCTVLRNYVCLEFQSHTTTLQLHPLTPGDYWLIVGLVCRNHVIVTCLVWRSPLDGTVPELNEWYRQTSECLALWMIQVLTKSICI